MNQNPYSVATRYFTEREGVDRVKLDMAIHFAEPTVADFPEEVQFVLCEARQAAILALWAIEGTVFQHGLTLSAIQRLYQSAQMTCQFNNPFVNLSERWAWERAFKAEVDDRVDDLIAIRNGKV